MHRASHLLPTLDLLGVVNARRGRVAVVVILRDRGSGGRTRPAVNTRVSIQHTMMSVASVMSRPASARAAYICAIRSVGIRYGWVARLRVRGAKTTRFFSVIPPSFKGLRRRDISLVSKKLSGGRGAVVRSLVRQWTLRLTLQSRRREKKNNCTWGFTASCKGAHLSVVMQGSRRR